MRISSIEIYSGGNSIKLDAEYIRSAKIQKEWYPCPYILPVCTAEYEFDKNMVPAINKYDKIHCYTKESSDSNELTEFVSFVMSTDDTDKNTVMIKTESIISLMEQVEFPGDMYYNTSAPDLIVSILETFYMNAPFAVSHHVAMSPLLANTPILSQGQWILGERKVTGHIPTTNCREALQLAMFASGCAYMSRKNEEGVWEEIISTAPSPFYDGSVTYKTISAGRVMRTPRKDLLNYDGIEVLSHTYKKSSRSDQETIDEFSIYAGEVVQKKYYFDRPMDRLTISSPDGIVFTDFSFEELDRTANMLTLRFTGHRNVTISIRVGYYLEERNLKKESLIPPEVAQASNFIKFDSKSFEITDDVLRAYFVPNLLLRFKTEAQIVEGKHIINGEVVRDEIIQCGDYVRDLTVDESGFAVSGFVTKESYNFNGNITIKNITIMG